ncbi:type VI secretion system-associated protein TagF [Paracoccus xiamenensis]|uniref:type VI secretion system-associated protein TagF n=1 Tax=Paracoccus xiamenensis TaxID=2714901 RepID=UPI00140BA3A2|nr:type VI secretion system-associated protein TagF [Paracoccus xiamenensis]NHF73853.1 type VI secretion system-associated protein TagF [Paracoccus xiamenensis]
MSAERRLIATAVFGKHPGFGDFLAAGELPAEGVSRIMDWLAQVLGAWREAAGPDWQAGFDRAPGLRFWIGAGLTGGTALRGALIPSRDRSGRRFPLVVAQATGGGAPVVDADQDFYTQADAELRALAQVDRFDPREVAGAFASQLPIPVDDGVVPGASFWATNATRAPREFLAELAATDYAHAQAGRSYWWFAADEQTGQQSGLMACAGWPGQHEMGWLLAGGRVKSAAAADEAQA